MKSLPAAFTALLVVSSATALAADAPTAQSILSEAQAKAKQEHKNVLVDFHASWCPWCVRLDRLYEDPKFGPKFKASFVFAPITVVERPALKDKTNAGWDDLMLGFRKAKDQDIPYVVILNPNGKVLADSYEVKGQRIPNNAGFPQTDDEITAYLAQLHKTAPAFSDADLADLKTYFLNVRATHTGH
jgi:thiol-disulfide isomerase/thioredoxin